MHEKNIALLCDEADRLLQLNINLLDRYKRSFVVNDLLRGCHENASQEG
nr:hypothetical protein [Escherichia coli]